MGWSAIDNRHCSIARALGAVGDYWSVLVLRDVFNGVHRFGDLQRHLGVARNVLSRRLADLVEVGVLARVPYQDPGERRRHAYELTERGRDLLPLLLALMAWGDRHLAGENGPPVVAEHVGCGATVRLASRCDAGHSLDTAEEIGIKPGPGHP